MLLEIQALMPLKCFLIILLGREIIYARCNTDETLKLHAVFNYPLSADDELYWLCNPLGLIDDDRDEDDGLLELCVDKSTGTELELGGSTEVFLGINKQLECGSE